MKTFADYMDQALYGPSGYYTTGQARSGREGDYFTAPDVGPAFGQLLTQVFLKWRTALGDAPFHWVEAGAGEGALAQSIGRALKHAIPEHASEIAYTAIERSLFRQEKLRQCAAAFSGPFQVVAGVQELATAPVSGLFFANELLDAFPVHRIRQHNGRLEEAYVDEHRVIWQAPSTTRLADYLGRIQVQLPEDYETEINLAMAEWFRGINACLSRGLVLLIDYGRPAHEYYDPERNSGTLRAFQNHHVSADVLQTPGQRDLTADVDFTSAALDAREAGLTPLAFMELGSLLLPGVEFVSASLPAPMAGLKYLIHPDGMGAAFHALVLGKNVPEITEAFFPHNRLQRLGLERIHQCSR